MKFRPLIAAGITLLLLYVFFLRFYILKDNETLSNYDEVFACGYVPYVDTFLYIDIDGKVLAVTSAANDDLPVIDGLRFKHFKIGCYLETDNNEVFNTIASLVKLLKKYNLEENFITKINVTNLEDIHLYTDNLDVAFGSAKDADEKIRTLKEIISNLHVAENVKGLLDISVIGRQYIFKVLT